jgi:DNA-binding response OmpR family regulator
MLNDNRPIRILLIEDNREHAGLLERLLSFSEAPRFSVAVACTLADGLAKLGSGTEDLVLLDLTLPDSPGVDTFRKVNAAAPGTPIVVLSGISEVTVAIEMVQEGAQDYLVKGQVDAHLLLRSIQYAIERKRAQVAVQAAKEELEARVNQRTAALVTANDRLQSEIAERRHAEEKLLKSNRQLTVALAELRTAQSERAAGVPANLPIEELGDVFRRIQQFAEIPLRAPAVLGNPFKIGENLRQILDAVEAGRRALQSTAEPDMLAIQAVETIAVDVLAERVLAMTKWRLAEQGRGAGSKVAVVNQVEKGIEIEGNPAQLRDMQIQLVLNAIGAIPRKGTVTLGGRRQGGEVVLSVQDDGLGITETVKQRLLNPTLASMHTNGKPAGYGLIHEVVARHGGRLEIESRKGLGTTVRIVLPPARASESAGTGRRVLVADDDPMVREVISSYLGEDGYEVELAANGREALEKFCAADFDIVLTDRSMPEMTGDQLAREVKRRNPNVPVLLLTGFGDIMADEGEKPEGVDEIMSKPFTMAGLHDWLAKFR